MCLGSAQVCVQVCKCSQALYGCVQVYAGMHGCVPVYMRVCAGCVRMYGEKRFENSLWEQTELNLCQNSLQTVVQGLHEKQYCTKHQLEPILKVEERAP